MFWRVSSSGTYMSSSFINNPLFSFTLSLNLVLFKDYPSRFLYKTNSFDQFICTHLCIILWLHTIKTNNSLKNWSWWWNIWRPSKGFVCFPVKTESKPSMSVRLIEFIKRTKVSLYLICETATSIKYETSCTIPKVAAQVRLLVSLVFRIHYILNVNYW